MLDKESFLREWVAALESDKYQQGVRLLSHGNKYCCLGVACEVAKVPFKFGEFFDKIYCGSSHGLTYTNPLFQILGESGRIPAICYKGEQADHLAMLNDLGMSFKDIAILIRKFYLNEDLPLPEGVRE